MTWQCSPSPTSTQNSDSSSSLKIKTIETYQVNPKSEDKKYTSSEYFDKDGNMIKRFTYDSYSIGGTDERSCTY